ncbi:DUF4232 domain-containing protein [Streptomyces klenkii]|uniref:DUF4232 domain-containing protein n=1 Tax=Streptomyces klenkii TaxID=1420899 RepID=A0A3B0BFV9_9ACTN|nr:DUF4232 domain-containing protein [Streptomyces klenkii]RKN71602.1 DUF4232 domain-containing protein [Streptomyces klenkii]
MLRNFRALPAVLAGAALLTACGTQSAGPSAAQASGTPDSHGDSPCEARPSPSGATSGEPGKDGVTITGAGRGARPCVTFEVTNREKEPFTYTVTFEFPSSSGVGMEMAEQTVPSVGPGRTARGTFTPSGPEPGESGAPGTPKSGVQDSSRVRVAKVRSVPTAEAPSQEGACPPSGVHVYVDEGNAAMGLRAQGIRLRNCGTQPYRLNGYPEVQLLDASHRAVDSVNILRGGSAISTGTGADGSPQPLALNPGEQAYSVLVWRNTVTSGEPVNAPYARVRAQPGAPAVMVTPEFDLGTTGQLGVGPWKKDDNTRAPATGGPAGTPGPGRPDAVLQQ